MKKYGLMGIGIVIAALLCFLPRPAYAYMDPGTTGTVFGSIWAILAPLLAMALIFIGAVIRPIRTFVASFVSRLLGLSRAEPIETDEQPAPGDSPEGDENGEDTGGELGR